MTYVREHAVQKAKVLLRDAIQSQVHEGVHARGPEELIFALPGFSALKRLACCVAIIGCLAGLYKLGYLDWVFRGSFWNIRNIPGLKKLLLKTQYDEFPDTGASCTLYAAKDVKNTAVVGKAELYCVVAFWFEEYESSKVKDGTWNESFTLPIPQGATTCIITLYSKGKLTTATIGEIRFDTLEDIITSNVTATKKWHKVIKDHKTTGQVCLMIQAQDVDGAGRVHVRAPLVDLPPDASMSFVSQIKLYVEDPNEVGISGQRRQNILLKAVSGPMQKLGGGLGGPKGEHFFTPVYMPNPDVEGGNPKMLWCWYKKKADFEGDPKNPLGAVPFIKVTKVNRDLKKDKQWSIHFKDKEGTSQELKMESTDREVEAWVEGFELIMKEAKEAKIAEKQQKSRAAPDDQQENWAEKDPEEKWAQWEKKYRKQGLSEDEIARNKREFLQLELEAAQEDANRLGKGKGAARRSLALGKGKGPAGRGAG